MAAMTTMRVMMLLLLLMLLLPQDKQQAVQLVQRVADQGYIFARQQLQQWAQ